jgi:sugar lactone lactonase YvrE
MDSNRDSIKFYYLLFSIILISSFFPPNFVNAENEPPALDAYVLSNSWGGESNVLNEPKDIAIGPDGRIYVVNRGLSRITIITPGNEVFGNFGNFGYSDGQLMDPEAIAIDDNGDIYVAGNSFVTKFTANGEFLTRWGYFNGASGIAVDSNGYVYVADTGNHRIRKFTSEGYLVKNWGSEGIGDGQFNQPMGVAVDSNNNIYIADMQNHRIQKFSSDGTYITQWGNMGSANGQFYWPTNVEIGNQGEIFVSDWGNYRVQVFDTNLNFISKWGLYGNEELHFRSPRGIAIDTEGNIIIAVAGVNLVHKYSPTYEFISWWGVKPTIPGQFYWPHDIVVDNDGNIFVADTNNRRIQKFNPFGVFLIQWELNFDGPNLAWPIKIDLDASGNVYVLDPSYSQVQKFDPNGNLFAEWRIQEGFIAVDHDYPTGIAIFDDQYIYVSGGNNNLVHKFNLTDGLHIKSWGGLGSSVGQFNYPFDVAVDSIGNVYVADSNNYRIQKFDADGNYITDWGVHGSMEGQFDAITSIITDSNDYIYILDSGLRSIQAFENDGYFISRWDTLILDPAEQLASPRGIAIDRDGKIFITDTHNNRIQVLAPQLPEPDPETGLILNGDFDPTETTPQSAINFSVGSSLDPNTSESINRSVAVGLDFWTYGGDLPISRTTITNEADYSVQLGIPNEINQQGIGSAWISQVFYVPYGNFSVLTFNYDVFTQDIIDRSDFIVEIQDAVGLSNKSIVIRDGYVPSGLGEMPEGIVELGWKSITYSLAQYRGKFIRLVISNRNLSPNSNGIWSYVENISVNEAPLPPLKYKIYLPIIIQ